MSEKGVLENIDCAILAGGAGTRLKDAVPGIPKPLAPVCGRPFISFILDDLALAGCSRAVLCVGRDAEPFEAALGGSSWNGMELVFSTESCPLDTGGAVVNALPCLRSETIMVLNGDSICRSGYGGLASMHREKKSTATLLLARVEDASRFGRVVIGAKEEIIMFHEKTPFLHGSCLVSAGVYLIDRGWLVGVPQRTKLSFEREMFPRLIGKGLFGCETGSPFLDIGTPESYGRAESFLASQGGVV